MNTVDVAPGSWWPMLRSPSRTLGPSRACSGTVACISFFCSLARGRDPLASTVEPPSDALAQDAHRRLECIDHRLVSRLSSAELDDAPRAPPRRASGKRRAVERLALADRATGPPQGCAPQRAASPPTVETSVDPAKTNVLPGGVAPSQLSELCHDTREAAVHVRPVIGVADRGIELGEVVALLVQRDRRPLEPLPHGRRVHSPQVPHRKAGVCTVRR